MSQTKSLFALIVLFFSTVPGFSQLTGIQISVLGSSNLSDQMWVFSVPTSTRYFDNGYDGYKMVGNPQSPMIYAVEPDGNYQIDVVPDLNNTYIAFQAGIDSVYTMTISNQYLSVYYKELYLIDSIAKKTIDIFPDGIQYNFSATNHTPIKRFKIVTTLPTSNPPVVPIDTIKPPVVIPDDDNCHQRRDVKKHKTNIHNVDKIIFIDDDCMDGTVTICNSITGRVLINRFLKFKGTTTLQTSLPAGSYTVYTRNLGEWEWTSKTIITR
jgi:hypothetical protein